MVRLKEHQGFTKTNYRPNFNSTMVRLKVTTEMETDVKMLFQFHYGAIKRGHSGPLFVYFKHFNSTMVRLKAAYGQIPEDTFDISIPLWCD